MGKDFYVMVRGWMDDDIFSPQPYTEREAFLYLIENASWKDRPFRIGTNVINLERGQLTASLRFLAEAWKWNKNKVDRFLSLMVKVDRVKIKSGTGQNIITICSYSKYQDIGYEVGTDAGRKWDANGTDVGQMWDKTNQDNQDNQDIEKPSQKKGKTNGHTIETEFKEDWSLPEEYYAYAIGKGFADQEINIEFERFTNYWKAKSGKDATKRDWIATWRSWILNAAKWSGNNGGYQNGKSGGSGTPLVDIATELINELGDDIP